MTYRNLYYRIQSIFVAMEYIDSRVLQRPLKLSLLIYLFSDYFLRRFRESENEIEIY